MASTTSSGGGKLVNFRDRAFFPTFRKLPDEEHTDPTFYRFTKGRFAPQKNWCFLAEIVSIQKFTRLVLNVKDKSGSHSQLRRVAFTRTTVGMNGSSGVRVEVPITVQIIPMPLADLLELNDRVHKYSPHKGGAEAICHGCDAQNTSMLKCGRCSMFWYCDKNCQTAGWNDKGHKNDCKIIKNCGLRAMFSLD